MAKRLGQAARQQPKSAPSPGADDLAIMHPDRPLVINGEKITVREYGFREGLHLQRVCAPVVAALAAAAQKGDGDFDGILGVLADHEDGVIELVARACDKPVAWVNELHDAEGHLLLLTWWAVNGGFFVRRTTMRMAIELAERAKASARAKSASAGETSTSASLSTASPAASTSAEGSPAGS